MPTTDAGRTHDVRDKTRPTIVKAVVGWQMRRMEKRTQPRLEWREMTARPGLPIGSGEPVRIWFAHTGSARCGETLYIEPTHVAISSYSGDWPRWQRDAHGLSDLVDAMVFAEDRALELCKAMFGKLLEADK
jgi:hypothetical protein